MEYLRDDQLLDVYQKAVDYDIDEDFILLLQQEIIRRGLMDIEPQNEL
ncbi:MAG: sporulation histidine kinase inhibitor Sda [Bacillaceae bacterium]|nr:sporulation histidine kinase inhibitor Sda [Bacillaceae bacterium]